ncbi:DUF3592 domain-containing protein [Hymenobacter jeollabukensis]|uniref:DUF3592 domain-containing protein n=1 Tax=Hymenobacter jeollabukensis TaxID=2025313 RepID=A0A5R8WMX9_9BACT|nr:DUF3592 domain-containing protein [Hymenobacter jeollabukensis]TLM91064.1 DUF3592 domain-containing protein [Hymenobacter jeollabukensis]
MYLSFSFEAVFFLLVGLFFLGMAWYMRRQQRARQLRGLPATATIIDFRPARSLLLPRVRFTAADGRTVETNTDSGVRKGYYEVGQQVPVIYDPADPENTDLAGAPPEGTTLLTLLGLVFAVVGGLQLIGIVPIFDAHQH